MIPAKRANIATLQAALAWKLFKPHDHESEALNSPSSLALSISTVALGASPIMKAALAAALALDDMSPEQAWPLLDDARAALAFADPSTFISADRFVYPPKIPLTRDMIAQFDRRGVSYAMEDLGTRAGIDAVNAWVKQATRGEIDGILGRTYDDLTAVVLNALYFKAKWETPFDVARTTTETFHNCDCARSQVQMMRRSGKIATRVAQDFVGVELPFAGDRFVMTLVTTSDAPSPLSRFGEVCGWLSGEGFGVESVELSMPRFQLEAMDSLLPALRADLHVAMQTPTPFEGFDPHFIITEILQRTRVEVNEEGAKAAAVTAIIVERGLVPVRKQPIIIDKPFLFAIRDRNSGLILVAGYLGKAPES